MRDDIHKNAPVPPQWRSVIKATRRDADWSSEGRRLLGAALETEKRTVSEGDFIKRLRDWLVQQAGLLPGVRDLGELRADCCPRNAAQEAVVGHAIRTARALGPEHVDVNDVLGRALEEVAANHFRAIEEHFSRTDPTQVRKFMGRLQNHNVPVLVRNVMAGSPRAGQGRPKLNVDDALPVRGQSRG